jgi:hypothetical protein
VFWDVALCSLVEIDRHFRGAYCLQGYLPDDGGSNISETLVSFYETTWHKIPEDVIFILSAVRTGNLTI